jgi:hypothetical protein
MIVGISYTISTKEVTLWDSTILVDTVETLVTQTVSGAPSL